jgi:hypothetical protein
MLETPPISFTCPAVLFVQVQHPTKKSVSKKINKVKKEIKRNFSLKKLKKNKNKKFFGLKNQKDKIKIKNFRLKNQKR